MRFSHVPPSIFLDHRRTRASRSCVLPSPTTSAMSTRGCGFFMERASSAGRSWCVCLSIRKPSASASPCSVWGSAVLRITASR